MNDQFTIKEVCDLQTKKEFLEFPAKLYQDEKKWVRPLNSDIENIFDPATNKMFLHGECCRWVMYNENNQTIGRVAAFIDHKTKNLSDLPTGGMGFFECINNKEVAHKLFDACKKWLEDRNIEAMDGPINFGERHQWWGLHVEGHHRPVYGMPYHMPYYKDFFESYGFQVYFKQFTYKTSLEVESMGDIIRWKAKRLASNRDYKVVHFDKKKTAQFIGDFVQIYNQTWAKEIPGVEGITESYAKNLFSSLKPIMHKKLMWFAYYKDQPIGFYIMLPDLNEVLQHLNGKVNLYGKLRFLYYKHLQKNKNVVGLIFGVIPSFQKRGIEAVMIYEFCKKIESSIPFRTLEMNWIGDFNPRMSHLMEHIGAKVYKTHYTYRKLFDETKEFKRAEIIK